MSDIAFRIVDWSRDPRSTEQLAKARAIEQERADIELERLWRERVAENIRRRMARKVEAMAATNVTPFYPRSSNR